ncbi:MAG: DUF3883 domain-containing protein [Bacteroidales bacterium]|nr:DUF3883 domain-containing protein [Candidatus Sodaliphilus limicaballi]
MFFQIHPEKKIGFKKLSSADLGQSGKSHQTHIGLFENVLTFLPETHIEKAAVLIHDEFCEILSCEYGKINRKDGSINAPKVKSGNRSKNTIVRKIREFAKQKPFVDWYLVWFGTDSNELVFWLISSDSSDYRFVKTKLTDFRVYDEQSNLFPQIIDFLERKINKVSHEILKDLEIASQVGDFKKKFKKLDLERAAAKCREIGRLGEELIAAYLDREKSLGKICNFIWENQSKEVGKPFDFVIDAALSTERFIDVKSTSFGFSQEVIFSENEIAFVNELNDDKKYYAFRVYDINEERKKLAICNKCLRYLNRINSKILAFHKDLAKRKAFTKSLNVAVKPEVCFKTIESSIIL